MTIVSLGITVNYACAREVDLQEDEEPALLMILNILGYDSAHRNGKETQMDNWTCVRNYVVFSPTLFSAIHFCMKLYDTKGHFEQIKKNILSGYFKNSGHKTTFMEHLHKLIY